MGNLISSRGCRGALLCVLFGIVASGTGLADSPATAATASSPNTPTKPRTTQSKAGSATTRKTTTKKTAHTSSSHKSSGQTANASRGKGGSKKRSSRKRGQQAIDHERARAIQQALIREHYLQGTPSGTWDAATQAAMQRYQADQGWQSKTTPDSRALIKLGLGPSNDHLLNPESAMTSAPAAGDPKATKPQPAQSIVPQR